MEMKNTDAPATAALSAALKRYLECDAARDVPGDTPAAQARAALAAPTPAAIAPAALTDEQIEEITEAREILENMVQSIELHGNYSTEATCTFLRQALQCLPVATNPSNSADAGEGS